MIRGFIALLIAVSAFAQTAVYPGAIATDQQLMVAANNKLTTALAAVGVADTSISVASTTGFAANMLISFSDSKEIAVICSVFSANILNIGYGTCPSTAGRGFDSTTATTHIVGAQIAPFMDAWHHNSISKEVQAIESALGVNLANVASTVLSSGYDFTAQAPGGSLAIGSNTITLTPVPLGVNGTDTHHYLYISGGTGTAEPCLITGGSGTSGQTSGTIAITCAGTHSGAWQVSSATAGIQESIQASAAPTRITIPAGTSTIYAPIYLNTKSMYLAGMGMAATTLAVSPSFSLSAPVITESYVAGGGVSDLTISFTQPTSSSLAAYTQYSPAVSIIGSLQIQVERVQILAAWDGIYARANGRVQAQDIQGNAFHHFLDIDNQADAFQLDGMEVSETGLNATQATVFKTNPAVYAMWIGYLSDGKLNNIVTQAGKCGNLHQGVTSAYSSFGNGLDGFTEFANIDCDNAGGLEVDGGQSRLDSAWFTIGGIAAQGAITQTGGTLQISNSHFYGSATPTPPIVLNFQRDVLDGATFAPSFQMSNSQIEQNIDVPMITATWTAYAGAGEVILTGNRFMNQNGGVLANPMIKQTAGSGGGKAIFTMAGNYVYPKLAGSGTFLSLASDFAHSITGNSMYGWGYSLAAGNNPVFSSNQGAVNNRQQLNISAFDDDAASATVASAATITPTGRYFWISGTTAIVTINVPTGTVNPRFCANPTGNWTTTTGGNIAVASTAVQGKPLCFKYDANTGKWGPTY